MHSVETETVKDNQMISNTSRVKNDTLLYILKHDGKADGLRVSNRSITLGNTIFVGLDMTAIFD